eukprot:Phypoly_transcript_10475.p1 GENE.Phypoly_transcript_10475~~Phypoly_transcript_10475.p1  ORF type:complete len:209 (+),score=49.38 Phypoly_transcript_10475:680-1306(+)
MFSLRSPILFRPLLLCKKRSLLYTLPTRSFWGKKQPATPEPEFKYTKITKEMTTTEALEHVNKLREHVEKKFEQKRAKKELDATDRQWKYYFDSSKPQSKVVTAILILALIWVITSKSRKQQQQALAEIKENKDKLQSQVDEERENQIKEETKLRASITNLLVQKLGSNLSPEEIDQLEKQVATLIENNKTTRKKAVEVPKDEEGIFF